MKNSSSATAFSALKVTGSGRKLVSASLLIAMLGGMSPATFAGGTQACFPPWSYSNDEFSGQGSGSWSKMYGTTCLASATNVQSPINITKAESTATQKITFQNYNTPIMMTTQNTTRAYALVPYPVAATVPKATMTVGTTVWTLQQVHFHTPAEHQIVGAKYNAEIHFVHSNSAGATAVLAVLVNFHPTGTSVPLLNDIAQIANSLPMCSVAPIPSPTQLSTLLPTAAAQGYGYYTYVGSLTTPPCTGSVTWYVLKTPLVVSDANMAALAPLQFFDASIGGNRSNNRAIQTPQPTKGVQTTTY